MLAPAAIYYVRTRRCQLAHPRFPHRLASASLHATRGRSGMSLSGIFARIVALIGAAAVAWRRLQEGAYEPAMGSAPAIPPAKPQGSIPTLKMPTAKGWSPGQLPVAAPGLKVNAFARNLD